MLSNLSYFATAYCTPVGFGSSLHTMSRQARKPVFGFPTRSDTNRHVQVQKLVRNLKFHIYEEEGLYYPCSENKGADQLLGYREADLRLCFRLCKFLVFSRGDSYVIKTRYV